MKFAHTADLHLSRYGQDKVEVTTNLPDRLFSIRQALYEIADYCKENGIFNLFIGGDTIHGKSIIYAIAQNLIIDFFADFPQITFWVIDGNHDITSKSSSAISALKFLSTIPNVKWIPFNTIHQEENILFVPYSHNLVDIIKENSCDILISHFGLTEGQLNSGLSIISDIGLRDLANYKLVILGHYHKPQEIIRDKFHLLYTGSPIQLDWGEKGEEKRFLVVDNETLKVDSIPLTRYRKHIEIEVTTANATEALKEAVKAKAAGHHVKLLKNDNVDLHSIENEFHIIDKTEVDITNRGITSNMTQKERFLKYLEIKEIPEEQQDFYLKTALDIVENSEV